MRICQGSRVEKISSHFQFNQKKQQCTAFRQQNNSFLCFLTNQRRAQVASSMKNILYEVVTWTWQKYFGSISLSLHTKKADQRAMSDSRVQREITLFQMTFEWKRASRVMVVVPALVLLTFVQNYKTGGRGGPQTVQRPNRTLDCDPVYERFSQQTNADVIVEQTEDGNQHRLVVWIENSPLSVTCLPPLCDACGFFVTYNASSSVQPGHEWWVLSAVEYNSLKTLR